MGSIAKIHEMLVSKQVSCTELTKSYLEEIEVKMEVEVGNKVIYSKYAGTEVKLDGDRKSTRLNSSHVR